MDSEDLQRSKIYLKDILIPVITAIVVVLVNQLFFESNKRSEYKIDFEMQSLKEQMPAFRRILLITSKYDLYKWTQLYVETKIDSIYSKTNDETTITIRQDFSRPDTLRFSIPSFAFDKELRQEFLENIEEIGNRKELLDLDVALKFHEVEQFLDRYPLPDNSDLRKDSQNAWNRPEVLQRWDQLMNELRLLVIAKLPK